MPVGTSASEEEEKQKRQPEDTHLGLQAPQLPFPQMPDLRFNDSSLKSDPQKKREKPKKQRLSRGTKTT